MIRQSVNRVIGLLCAITLLLGCFMQPAMAAQGFSDVENHSSKQAIEMLAAIGVVEGNPDGTFKPDELVTRAEIITMILRATDLADYARDSAPNPFTDTENHWARDNIAFAYNLGYVSGNGDGTFVPDASVTYEQAVKMAVNMIDYGIVAQQKGGYPYGYIAVAAENKITDNIDSAMGKALTRGQVAQLIYNAMNTPMLVQSNWGNDVSYNRGTEKDTLLAKFTLETDGYGIVTKVGHSAIDDVVGTDRENMIEIAVDEKRYLMDKGNTDADRFLGREVDFLAVSNPRDDDKYTLVYIKETERSESITVEKEDIIDADYGKKIYTYYAEQGGKEKTLKLSDGAAVIYNNQYVERPSKADMIPDNGYVVFVENNGSAGFDAVFVYDFDDAVVSSHNVEDDTLNVYFKTGSRVPVTKLEIEAAESDEYVIAYFDGEYISKEALFEKQIPEWTAASVAKSRNGNTTEVHFSTKTASGTVDGSSDDEGNLCYSIDGEWYYVSSVFGDELRLGEEYTLVISIDNRIVAINTDITSNNKNYALLLARKMMDNGLEENRASFKLLLSDGQIVIKDAAEKVRINNTSIKLNETDIKNIPEKTIIIFDENSEGEIDSIETADDSNVCTTTAGYIDYGEENVFTLNASTNLYYKNSEPATLGGDVKVDESTLVFDVSSSDEEEWGIGDPSVFNNETVYIVDIYDIDKFKMAKVVVNYGPAIEQDDIIPWGNSPVVIKSVNNKLDSNGDPVRVLIGMQNGEEFEMKLKDGRVCDEEKENYLINLKPGSVVQIKANMLDEIVSIRKLYRAPTETEVFETLGSRNWEGTDYNVKLHTCYGMCVDINEDIMTVAFRLDDKVKSYSISQANIYVFNAKKKTLEIGDYTDAKPASSYGYDDCSRVFVRMEKDNVKDIVIYE